MKRMIASLVLAALLISLMGARATALEPDTTLLVSVSSSGGAATGDSDWPSISADGRYVAFQSSAANLLAGDANGRTDIFVRDLVAGTTELVSVSSSGTQGNWDSLYPSISADGRYVAFQSFATNLVPDDTNWTWDVFVHDRQSRVTERVSLSGAGLQAVGPSERPAISADGRYVAFQSQAANLASEDTNGRWDVFVRDRQAGTTERVSLSTGGGQGTGDSSWASISTDGRHVAFQSYAANLVPDDTNGVWDIFVHDRQSRTTERISLSGAGLQGTGSSERPAISADGRYVAFQSQAANLVAGDSNWNWDIFVRDRETGTTERVSVSSGGGQGSGDSYFPSLSADGRHVAFQSYAPDLVAADTNGIADLFLHGRQPRATERVSVSSAGVQANRWSSTSSVSRDGRLVAFASSASNLVAGDSNGRTDVFVRSRGNLDTIPPTTTATLSGTAGSNGWYTSDVLVSLAATDEGGSGVKELTYGASGAQTIASTTVSGTSAAINITAEGETLLTFRAMDNAGNLEAPRTVRVKLDRTPPAITITAPADQSYLLNQRVQVAYGATDAASGVGSCAGTLPQGSYLDTTSPGAGSFAVNATDNAGNSAVRTVSYMVRYGIRALYDPAKAANSGSTLPIRLQLVDAAGGNLSAPALVVTARAISPTAPLNDSGRANPEDDFRYDVELGDTGGYIYNMSTRDLPAGAYTLEFTVGNDPVPYGLQFQVSPNVLPSRTK